MSDGPNIVRIASLIGDPARAEMLTALMDGRALTASELAQVASIGKPAASAHLSKLRDAKLLTVEAQGRHRYFRLADRDVARLLENLMGVAQRTGALRLKAGPREPALRKARVCYDHLAGEFGVLMFDALHRRRLLRGTDDGSLAPTPRGQAFLQDFGLDLEALASGSRRPLCRTCLDWSERRHHLAGILGAALLARCFELRWARRERGSRVVQFSPGGERAFRARFALSRP